MPSTRAPPDGPCHRSGFFRRLHSVCGFKSPIDQENERIDYENEYWAASPWNWPHGKGSTARGD